jgi:cytochrome c-type biogenesis protein CcmE
MPLKPRHRRAVIVLGGLAALAVAGALVLNALRSNMVFFYTPSQVAAHEAPQSRAFRVGGLVLRGSLQREGTQARFVVTDTAQTVTVSYTGILPDLFGEGKGVVAQGQLGPDGIFHADQVLAKHDENYMPPDAKDAVRSAQRASAGPAGSAGRP